MYNKDNLGCNIEKRRGQEALSLGKCDDEDYDNDDGKVLFGDDYDDDDDEDNDDHHDVELSFGSCFGSAWQFFQKYQFLFS